MNKKGVLNILRISKQLFILMSGCTKMPYVKCDEETQDDEVLIYLDEKEAKEEAERMTQSGEPVTAVRLENKGFLSFYTNLYSLGVNSLRVKMQHEDSVSVQLNELIMRKEPENKPDVPPRIENPAFHLTALYFMQLMRSKHALEKKEELEALNEEMTAHFQKGKYFMVVSDDGKMPLLKQKDGKAFQPIFTDIYELMKFDKEKKFKMVVVEVSKLPDLMAKEAAGVAVNPMGVNLILNVTKKSA